MAAGLTALSRHTSLGGALGIFAATACGVLLLVSMSVVSYLSFFRGNPHFFWQLMGFPLTLAAVLFGLATILRARFPQWGDRLRVPKIHVGFGVIIGGIGCVLLHEIFSYWGHVSLRVQHWRELGSFPYALAVVPLLPAALVLLVFLLLLVLKSLIPPLRLAQWAQMAASKELGITYIGGYIMMISAILGGLTSLLLRG